MLRTLAVESIPREISIVIADDHELVRYGLRTVLEDEQDLTVVGEASNGLEAIEKVKELKPDLLLLDLRMPEMGGVDVCAEAKKVSPETKVLILTSYDGDDEVFGALAAGASSYLMKDVTPVALIQTIRGVAEGRTILDSSIAPRIIEGPPKPTYPGEALSERELEVLELMAQGLKNKEIAQTLWISQTTVKTHVSHILQKLGQSDRTQAHLMAIRHGLVKVSSDK